MAASRLLFARKPDAARRIAETIGLVASFSGGLTQFYQSGSTVKRIHAARASENGVAAALMVAKGFSGPVDILEGSNGFARAYADGFDPNIIAENLGSDYLLCGVTVKGHACSVRVQAAVEGVVALCRQHHVGVDDIQELYVGIPAIILGRLTIPRPVDIQAAQMSLSHSVALAAVLAHKADSGFSLSVRDYEDSMASAVVKGRRAPCRRCEVDAEVEKATTAESVPARIVMKLKSGACHSIFVAAPKGSLSRSFTRDDHVARFRGELERRWQPDMLPRCDCRNVPPSRRLEKHAAADRAARLIVCCGETASMCSSDDIPQYSAKSVGIQSRMTSRPRLRKTGKRKPRAALSGFGPLAERFANSGTAAEIAYAVLREAILTGILAPGARLRADELARQLGVSKTPVREALRKLQAEDLIEMSNGNALSVKVLSEKQLLEIYYTREALEGMAARQAAENAGSIDLTNMREVLDDLEAALKSSRLDDIREFTGEFHLAVFKAAHNDFLYDLLKSLQEKIRNHRTTTMSVPGRDDEVVAFCRDLLHAIEQRDPAAAGTWAVARINRRRTLETSASG